MWVWLHKFGSPKYFYDVSGKILPWVGGATALLILIGLYLGLFASPADYQQRDTVRIMYIHVPSAWNSMFIYLLMATAAAIGLIWNIKIADIVAAVSAPIGASFTLLTLVTGSLWGKPMWGTWWEWDARLTSELILLFLYLGYIALQSAFEDRRTAARASAVLAIVGAVNVPIIYYSVQWWNTLHQPQSLGVGTSAIHPSMLWPLLLMAIGFKLLYVTILLLRTRAEVLERERNSVWVQELVQDMAVKSASGLTRSNHEQR